MRRRGFTLVEILTVVAILGLLLAVLAPSLSAAWGLARATVCRGNLHGIGVAFATSKAARDQQRGSSRQAMMAFPEWDRWPGIPSDVVPEPELYRCPESEPNGTGRPSLNHLAYVPPSGISVPLEPYSTEWFISRDGRDARGSYREYLIQDDGARDVGKLNWHGWIDSDGLFRVYHSGWLAILDKIPDTPEFSGAYAPGAGPSTCGDNNRIFIEGEPLFEGKLSAHRGETFRLEMPGVGLTNYGINTVASRYPAGSNVIVLLDYRKLEADPDIPAETQELLYQSARHLGRLNVLTADGRVGTKYPLDLSPELHPDLWKPPK